MVVRQRRAVPSPAPSPAPGPAPGAVLSREGEFSYFRDGHGPKAGRFVPAKFKAVFAADPEGCHGFGDTEAAAETMLRRYAALHEEGRDGASQLSEAQGQAPEAGPQEEDREGRRGGDPAGGGRRGGRPARRPGDGRRRG